MKKGTLWLGLGVICLGAAFFWGIHNEWEDHRAGVSSDAVYEELSEAIQAASASAVETTETDTESVSGEAVETAEETPLYELYPEISMPIINIDGYDYIGTLEVPSADIKLPVMDTWDYTRLKIAPCCYSGSVYTHDIVIAGHNYSTHFSPLKWMDEGTKVVFTDADGNEFDYRLSYKEVLEPTMVEDMVVGDGDWDMTLFTCTTGGRTRMALRFKLED